MEEEIKPKIINILDSLNKNYSKLIQDGFSRTTSRYPRIEFESSQTKERNTTDG